MWFIGIDDTDVPGSRGTGRLARMVAEQMVARGMRNRGVTRHQLLVHPDVPYTSHNSSACVAVEGGEVEEEWLFAWLCDFVGRRSPPGSDPGVCVARAESATWGGITAFGERAKRGVLSADEANAVARLGGCRLAGLAGSRLGVIGALAAVGLRAGGNDGRFIDLDRIRNLTGAVTARELLAAGVERIVTPDGEDVGANDLIETYGWVRPRLSGGLAVVLLERRDSGDDVVWAVADRRHDGRA